MKETFAGRLRDAARSLGRAGSTFTVKDLGHAMGIKTYAEHDTIRSALRDFLRRGEMVRTAPGVFRYQERPTVKPQIRERMWRILRARRRVTVEDLQELAGASRSYAEEWLRMLTKRAVVRKCGGGVFRMVEDPVAMLSNDEKAEQLRELRARKKAALAALEKAEVSLTVARNFVSGMVDG